MQRIIVYTLIFFGAYTYQLLIVYQTNLVPGTTGAYYLVQLRSILEKGSLGFPDMPFYFYLLATLHQAVSWFTDMDSNLISIHVVKWVSAILIPMALIPWYFIIRELQPRKIPLQIEVLLACMLTCTYTPLFMLGNFQKNAFAFSFILWLILCTVRYLKTHKPIYLLGIGGFYVIILLSHFGTLNFTLIMTGIAIALHKGKKSCLPLAILGASTFLLLSYFDPVRAKRLLFIITEIFQRPAIFYSGKPYYVLTALTYLILALGLVYYYHARNVLEPYEKLLIRVCFWTMILITFPFLEAEYVRRLSLMLIIPQVIVLFFIWQFPWSKIKNSLALCLSAYVIMSLAVIYIIKRPTLSEPIYSDLEKVDKIIKDRNNTIIVARHGLEYWVSWSLHVKVANNWGVDSTLLNKYNPVLFIEQKNNIPIIGLDYLADPKPKEGNLKEVYDSEHFKLYEWSY